MSTHTFPKKVHVHMPALPTPPSKDCTHQEVNTEHTHPSSPWIYIGHLLLSPRANTRVCACTLQALSPSWLHTCVCMATAPGDGHTSSPGTPRVYSHLQQRAHSRGCVGAPIQTRVMHSLLPLCTARGCSDTQHTHLWGRLIHPAAHTRTHAGNEHTPHVLPAHTGISTHRQTL